MRSLLHSSPMPTLVWCRATFFRRLLPVGVAVLFFFSRAGGAAAAPADYLIDVLDTKDNLPSSTVTAITQTPDGYLWIGTYNGLARFDGVRFVTFEPGNTPELGHSRIQGLFLDVSGTLWINTYRGGLTSFRDGVFRKERPTQAGFDLHTTLAWSSSNVVVFVEQFGDVLTRKQKGTNFDWSAHAPPAGTRPFFQCADQAGNLWLLSREGKVMRFVGGEFKELPPDGGLGTNRVHTLVTDARGQVWAGADNLIARWDGKMFAAMSPTNGEAGLTPSLLFPTRDGAMWVLDGDRLRKMAGRKWVAEAVEWRGLLGWAGGRGMGAHEDASGGLWFNHYGNGVFHITPEGGFQRLTTSDGLPGDRVGAWSGRRGVAGRGSGRAGAIAGAAVSTD